MLQTVFAIYIKVCMYDLQGKRHKENVAKRVETIAKRGAEEYAKNSAYEKEMAKIEAAALAAVAKDGVALGK